MNKFTFALLTLLLAPMAHAGDSIIGLICDDADSMTDGKMQIEITVKGDQARLSFRDPRGISGAGQMLVAAEEIQPILNNDLNALSGVTVSDLQKETEITFINDGASFDGKPRLAATVTGNLNFNLRSCSPKFSGSVSLN